MRDYERELFYRLVGDITMTDEEKFQSELRKQVFDVRREFDRHLETHCCHERIR